MNQNNNIKLAIRNTKHKIDTNVVKRVGIVTLLCSREITWVPRALGFDSLGIVFLTDSLRIRDPLRIRGPTADR